MLPCAEGCGRPGTSTGLRTLIVTKQTRPERSHARERASRVLEIDALLARWDDPERLTFVERLLLEESGFPDLQATRKRGPKVSAKAKALLLSCELDYREREAEPTQPEAQRIEDYRFGAQRLMEASTALAHGNAINPETENRIFHLVDERLEVERDAAVQLRDRLRRQLGAFAAKTPAQREAAVRKWDQRRRARRARSAAPPEVLEP